MDWSSSNDNRSPLLIIAFRNAICITSCKQQSAPHKRRMVNLWPNLTAFQYVSFVSICAPFYFAICCFQVRANEKITLRACKSLCSFANGRSGFHLVAVTACPYVVVDSISNLNWLIRMPLDLTNATEGKLSPACDAGVFLFKENPEVQRWRPPSWQQWRDGKT